MSISTKHLHAVPKDINCNDSDISTPLQVTDKSTQETSKSSIHHLTDKSESPIAEQSSSSVQSESETTKPVEVKPENGPTPPPSGINSKPVPKKKITVPIEQMFETFHQSPTGEFKPTFYNPFEVKHRRRTSRSQFKTLERAFMENCKPSASVRKNLADELNMSQRSIQVWFQNRRAKLKTLMKTGKLTEAQMIEYLAKEHQNQQGEHEFYAEEEVGGNKHDSPSSFEDSEPSDHETASVAKSGRLSFSVERRRIPTGNNISNNRMRIVKHVSPDSFESMSLANSYPNQVRNRSYSLPNIQRSPQLPFKQLQEALFGNPMPCTPATASASASAVLNARPVDSNTSEQAYSVGSESCREYYNPSLNAFQHYFRASDAAMSRVSHNYSNTMAGYYAAAHNTPSHHINLPQLSITPLANDYQQVCRRPRSSSFAYGNRPCNEGISNGYDMLAAIKEDSPISEYMSLPNSTSCYYNDQVEEESGLDESSSSGITQQINSLDLDYFMSGAYNQHHNQQVYHESDHFDFSSSCYPSSSTAPSSSASASASTSNSPSNRPHENYELSYLPQPTNEILLSTLIDDEHFLH